MRKDTRCLGGDACEHGLSRALKCVARSWVGVTAGAMLLVLAAPSVLDVARAELARRGGEFMINSVTEGNQRWPSIAAFSNGEFAVVWTNEGQVAARRFDAATNPLGPEFQVNSTAACFPPTPHLAAAPDGSLLIGWCAVNDDGVRFIHGRRITANAPEGPEFTIAEDPYTGPNLASVGHNQFVVAWTGYYRGYARLIEPGEPGPVFTLADRGDQYDVAAAGNDDGSFRVVWYDGSLSLQGRSFRGSEPSGEVFDVSRVFSTRHQGPVICSQPSSNFVVSWATYGTEGSAPVSYRRFDAGGLPLGAPQLVTPEEPNPRQAAPALTCGPGSDFTVLWHEISTIATDTKLRGRAFRGPLPPSDFSIGLREASGAGPAAIQRLADGDLLVVWPDCGLSTGCDLFGQRLTFAPPLDCLCDCNRDRHVEISELVTAVNIALNPRDITLMKSCLPADRDLDYHITIAELVEGTQRALGGCL